MKVFDKSKVIIGKHILLRAATVADANFVFEMRRIPTFLPKIVGTVEDQARWLEGSYSDPYQFYLVIEALLGESLGLVRIYDQIDESFCWGSWRIKKGAPASTAMESALLVYRFAIDDMKFSASHFDVRIGNEKVINFHKRLGAVEVARSDKDIFFEIDLKSIRGALVRYKKFLPEGE